MPIPYELYCTWKSTRHEERRVIKALVTDVIDFVPPIGFTMYVGHKFCPDLLVKSVSWDCARKMLIIDAEYESKEDYLDQMHADMTAKRVPHQFVEEERVIRWGE